MIVVGKKQESYRPGSEHFSALPHRVVLRPICIIWELVRISGSIGAY